MWLEFIVGSRPRFSPLPRVRLFIPESRVGWGRGVERGLISLTAAGNRTALGLKGFE